TFTRVAAPDLGSISIRFDAATGASSSRICPCSSAVRARRCFFTMFTPCTSTRPVLAYTRSTVPSLPLSSPRITRTVSPLVTWICMRSTLPACRSVVNRWPAVFRYVWTRTLQHLRRERRDLHVSLVANLARHRPEHARRAWLTGIVNDDHRILIEPDVRSVLAAGFLRG